MKKTKVFSSVTVEDRTMLFEMPGYAFQYEGIDLVYARDIKHVAAAAAGVKPAVSFGGWVAIEPITGKSITKTIQHAYKTRAAALLGVAEIFKQYGYAGICEKIFLITAKYAVEEQEQGPIQRYRIGEYCNLGVYQ
jgi:hypothetical protein